jgi:hypothetical protein
MRMCTTHAWFISVDYGQKETELIFFFPLAVRLWWTETRWAGITPSGSWGWGLVCCHIVLLSQHKDQLTDWQGHPGDPVGDLPDTLATSKALFTHRRTPSVCEQNFNYTKSPQTTRTSLFVFRLNKTICWNVFCLCWETNWEPLQNFVLVWKKVFSNLSQMWFL